MAEERARLAKCVSHKLEVLSMNPQDPYSIGVGTRQRQKEPWSLLVNQPSQMEEFREKTIPQKIREQLRKIPNQC